MTTTKLIEQVISGKSAQYVVDALVEELPPLPALKASIRRDLPSGCEVTMDGEVVYIAARDDSQKQEIQEQIEFLRRVYPELEFVVRR